MVKICQFWGREIMPLTQKYEERVWKFSFLARYHLKQNYIVIFISLSLVNLSRNYIGLCYCVSRSSMHCQLGGLSTQNPELVNLPPLLVPKQGRKDGAGTMRVVCKFRSSRLEALQKNISSENFGKFLQRQLWWAPVLIKLQGL